MDSIRLKPAHKTPIQEKTDFSFFVLSIFRDFVVIKLFLY